MGDFLPFLDLISRSYTRSATLRSHPLLRTIHYLLNVFCYYSLWISTPATPPSQGQGLPSRPTRKTQEKEQKTQKL